MGDGGSNEMNGWNLHKYHFILNQGYLLQPELMRMDE